MRVHSAHSRPVPELTQRKYQFGNATGITEVVDIFNLGHLSALKTVISPAPFYWPVTLVIMLELIRVFKINKLQPKSHSRGFMQPQPTITGAVPPGKSSVSIGPGVLNGTSIIDLNGAKIL